MAAITGIDTDRMGERFVNPNGRNLRNVWTFPTQPSPVRGVHFATFPEALPERCIKAASKEGDLILDPFAGSGTTLWVAKKLGRKAVGYELSGKYCELAIDRNRQSALIIDNVCGCKIRHYERCYSLRKTARNKALKEYC
jgi:DNA modification methylase